MRDSERSVWTLETSYNEDTEQWDIARPVRVAFANGAELRFAQDALGAVRSITDSYGRRIALDWVMWNGRPFAVSQARLPDGTHIDYIYNSIGAGAIPERLAAVERRDAANTLLDKTSYDYGDARYPTFVTAIRDRDGAVRWNVAYDGEARAVSSSGPGGVQAVTVTYGADGTSFNRTVTNALGKSETYNFTRSNLLTYDPKFVGIVGAASAGTPASSAGLGYATNKFLGSSTDEEGRTTGYTRDPQGRPTQITEAQGTPLQRVTGVTWHPSTDAPTEITEPGLTTTTAYSAIASAGFQDDNYATGQAFAYTGSAQGYVVPSGASEITVELWGGAGGNGNYSAGAWSGAGAYVKARFAVTPGDALSFEVAGGGQGAARNAPGGAGGWPDGGPGGMGNRGSGGGGGSTRFYINGVLKAVAGGGGGSGGYDGIGGSAGAGGPTGQDAPSPVGAAGGSGGSQSAGGVDLSDATNANKTGRSILVFPGVQRTGGWGAGNGTNTTSSADDGGGGGGGYWGGGGGGGDGAAGGGGSSWVDASALAVDSLAGNRQFPARHPTGQPTVALGVNSAANGPAVAGGDGYAFVGVK